MPTSRENIEKWSWKYWLVKVYQDFFFHLYYKTEIVGLEKLPPNTTLIFALNHQNALMDALAILAIRKNWQPVFLARADIFKKTTTSKILTFFKIMPVYRIRDGYENLSLNDDIFRKTMDVFNNQNGLIILPEGNHAGVKRLRQLKKGIARIAFQAEDASNKTLNIHIVPVGLEYSNYVRFHSKLLIRIGEPFEIKKYLELYYQNKALAYNALMAELELGLKKEMINIDDEENYDAYLYLINLITPKFIESKRLPKTQNQQFLINKKLIAQLDGLKLNNETEFNSIIGKSKKLGALAKHYGINSRTVPISSKISYSLPLRALTLLLTLPLFIYGTAGNIIPIIIPYYLSVKFQDVQFYSSVRHAAGLILFPLTHIIQTVILGLIVKDALLTLAYFVSLPVGAFVVYHWRCHFIKLAEALSMLRFSKAKPNGTKQINKLYAELFNRVEKLL